MKRLVVSAAIATASLAAPAPQRRELIAPVRHNPVPLAVSMRQIPVAPLPMASIPPLVATPIPDFVPGQDEAAYSNWLARDPSVRARVGGFESFLKGEGLADVLPTWQLTRTASDYEKCDGPGFEVAPIEEWQHIAATLRFIKTHVKPVIGPVEAKSGYRNPDLNACAGGAKESAHRHFFALDLVPVRNMARAGLIRSICAIHDFRGRGYDIGLGFYQGTRFHIDSKGFRRWGPNGKGATSPCVTGI